MEEVIVNNLEIGKDYYIQIVGRYATHDLQSGKAIGKKFKRTLTFQTLLQELGPEGNFDVGIPVHCFENNRLFVEFEEVVPVNPGVRECGICHFRFYPAVSAYFNGMTPEEQNASCGGYKFFKMKRDEVEKRWADSVMKQGVKQVDSAREEPALSANMTSFMGGKKRRRKRKTRRTSANYGWSDRTEYEYCPR